MEPITTKTMTDDGWITRRDYGAQGVSTVIVHVAPCSEEEAGRNRRALDRVLRQLGYEVAAVG